MAFLFGHIKKMLYICSCNSTPGMSACHRLGYAISMCAIGNDIGYGWAIASVIIFGNILIPIHVRTILENNAACKKARTIIFAVYWYRKAAEQGYSQAQTNLGICYHYGEGVEKNITKAKYWYRKAAEQGNEGAKIALMLLEYAD